MRGDVYRLGRRRTGSIVLAMGVAAALAGGASATATAKAASGQAGQVGRRGAHDGQTALRGGARHRPQDRLSGRPAALLHALRSSSRKEPAPRTFVLYAALVTALALASLVLLPWVRMWQVDAPALFLVLSAFVLAGELLPIPVPRRGGLARVTISAAFAFAILLRFGPGPAVLVYVASSVIADVAGGSRAAQDPLQRGAVFARDRRCRRGAAARRGVAAERHRGQPTC